MSRLLLILLLLPTAAPAVTCTDDAARGGARPELSGPVQVWETEDGRYRFHWTEEGEDAITGSGDSDGDGLPDGPARALLGLRTGDEEFALSGYRAAVRDDGAGGSDAIDVLFRAIDANGYAFAVPGAGETSSCVIQLESSLGDSLDGVLESVAAHELHHCVQYAYTTSGPSWMLESTATLEQYRLFSSPGLAAAVEVLWRTRLTQPDRPLADLGGRYEYAGFVFQHFWESLDGGAGSVPQLWEALAAADGDADAALESESERVFGQSFRRTFLDHATWNAWGCARDDGLHYDHQTFPCDLPDTRVPITDVVDEARFVLSEGPYTAVYAERAVGPERLPVEATCTWAGAGRVGLRLLALDRLGREEERAEVLARDGEPFSVRLAGPAAEAGTTLLVFVSTAAEPVDVTCSLAEVPVAEEPPAGPEPGSACAGCDDGGGASVATLLLLLFPKRRRRRTGARRRRC